MTLTGELFCVMGVGGLMALVSSNNNDIIR